MVLGIVSVCALLSASPVQAKRVAVEEQDILGVEGGHKKWIGRANCDELQERFEGRVNQTQQQVEGDMDFEGSTRALLRTWSMVRTMSRASGRDCEWATGQQFDTSSLASLTERSLAGNPCLSDAQAVLASAEELEEPERSTAFLSAMQILLSPPGESCRTVTDEDIEEGDEVDAEERELLSHPSGAVETLEDNGDEMAETLTEAALQASRGGGQESLAQTKQALADEWGWGWGRARHFGRHVLAPIGRVAVTGAEFAAANVPVYPGAVAPMGAYLVWAIGVVVWMIIFTLLCTVATHIITLVLGAILCMLRWFFNIIILRPHRSTLPVCLYQWGRNVQGSDTFRFGTATVCAAVSAVPLLTAR